MSTIKQGRVYTWKNSSEKLTWIHYIIDLNTDSFEIHKTT